MKINNTNKKLISITIIYILICVWVYFNTTVTMNGVQYPTYIAGQLGLVIVHGFALFGILGAVIVNFFVNTICNLFNKKK